MCAFRGFMSHDLLHLIHTHPPLFTIGGPKLYAFLRSFSLKA